MELELGTDSRWYQRINEEVSSLKTDLPEKEQKKLKLERLLRIAARVDQFSVSCGECQLKK